MPRQFERYRTTDGTTLDPDYFNTRFGDLDARLADAEDALQGTAASADAEIETFRRRTSAVLEEFVSAITGMADVGSLAYFEGSAGPDASVGVGERTLTVWPSYRGRIIAPGYVLLTAAGDPSASIGGPIKTWNQATGELVLSVIYTAGSGTHQVWRGSVSAATHMYPAQEIVGSRIRFMRDDGQWGAWLDVGGGDISSIVGLAEALSLRPTLGQMTAAMSEKADRGEVLPLIAGKADAGHTHSIAAIQGLSAALEARAALNHAHDMSAINGLGDALSAKAPLAAVSFTDQVEDTSPSAADQVMTWRAASGERRKATLKNVIKAARAAIEDVWAGLADDKVVTPKVMAEATAFVESSGAGAWSPDLSKGLNFRRVATGASTLTAPTNGIIGRTYIFALDHGSVGGRWGVDATFDFGGGSSDFSTAPGKVDHVIAVCIAGGPVKFLATIHKAG